MIDFGSRSGGGARNALTPGYCLSRLRREEVNYYLRLFAFAFAALAFALPIRLGGRLLLALLF